MSADAASNFVPVSLAVDVSSTMDVLPSLVHFDSFDKPSSSSTAGQRIAATGWYYEESQFVMES